MKKCVFHAVRMLVFFAVLGVFCRAQAEGNDVLGPTSLLLPGASGVITAGTGLVAQPGKIKFDVPEPSNIRAVILYWQGFYNSGTSGDDTLSIRKTGAASYTSVKGVQIGLVSAPGGIFSATYRADITALEIVDAGANSLDVTGLNFSNSNNGAGVAVLYDDFGGLAPVLTADGDDYSTPGGAGALGGTAPVVFTFDASTAARDGAINLLFSGIDCGTYANGDVMHPNSIEVTVDGKKTIYSDLLVSSDGLRWDSLTLPVHIPPGVTSVTVRAFSRDDKNSGKTPATIVWNYASLVVHDCNPICSLTPITASCTGANTVVQLTASASDPEGKKLNYDWSTSCSGATISDTTSATPTLTLTAPGMGQTQSCTVSLSVDESINAAHCNTTVNVPACTNSCQTAARAAAKIDNCGVCGGDNSTCCTQENIMQHQFVLDGAALKLKELVRQFSARMRSLRNGPLTKEERGLVKEAKEIYLDAWTNIWSLPRVVNECTGATGCEQKDISAPVQNYLIGAKKLSDIVLKFAKLIAQESKKQGESKALQIRHYKKLVDTANSTLTTVDAEAKLIPALESVCG